MSNYCACSGGDEEYTIELNQQGPPGPQGLVGPEGFSPSISIKTNTDKAYVLTIVNKEGSFDTPNLYGELEKLNADLSNIPNPAFINGIALSRSTEGMPSIEIDGSKIATDVDGNLMLSASSEDEEGTESFNYEVVVNPTEQRLELHDNEGNIKVVAVTDEIAIVQSQLSDKLDKSTYEADKSTYATKEELASTDATVANLQTSVESNTTSIGSIRESLGSLTNTVINNATDIAALDSTKLESSNIIAGTNITIDRSGNNLTISSTGGGGGEGGTAIDDSTTSSASTWSSSKISSEITTVATELRNTKNDNIFDISKFTVVGSPTITDDGIVSGISDNNYIKKDISLNLENEFNIIGNFKLEELSTPVQAIISICQYNTQTFMEVRKNSDTNFAFVYADSETTRKVEFASFNFNKDIKYVYKIEWDKINIKFYLGTDLSNITLIASFVPFKIATNNIKFGTSYNGSLGLNGSIDIKNFLITVNGEVVFNSTMESTKPIYDTLATFSTFETETNNNFSAVNSALNEKANLSDLASKQNVLTAGENITIEGNVISATGGGVGSSIDDSSTTTVSTWSSSKINSEITTVVNTKNDNIFDIGKFTVVGSPTITDDGVLQGTSNGNYLTKDIDFGTGSWKISLKFNQSSYSTLNSFLYLDNNNRMHLASALSIFANNSGFNLFINNNFELGIDYLIDIYFDGISTYKAIRTNLNTGIVDTDIRTSEDKIVSGLHTWNIGKDGVRYFDGSIDLKQFSITVDGEKVLSGLMESTKPIYDKLSTTTTELSNFKLDTNNNFSAVESALNEKANLSDLAGYVTITKYNELLARVTALETEINGGNA